MKVLTLVTHAKGSWKYQDAFHVSEYVVAARKSDGVLIWKFNRMVSPKLSMPQFLRGGWSVDMRGRPDSVVVGLCGELSEYGIGRTK